MDSVLRNYFAGGGFAKPRLKFFEIRRDLSFRPAGGRGRNAGRDFGILFLLAELDKIIQK